MSTVVINGADLTHVCDMLRIIFPKGSPTMPVGLHLRDSKLIVTCVQGCVFQASLNVECDDDIGEATINYRDLSPLIHSTATYELEFNPTDVVISTEDLEVKFSLGYSVVDVMDFSQYKLRTLEATRLTESLLDICSMSLEKLYGLSSVITCNDNICLQKFPNTWVQTRAGKAGIKSIISTEHATLIAKFQPRRVCDDVAGTLLFESAGMYVQIPCKPLAHDSNITDLMSNLSEPINLTLTNYLDRVRNISKVDTKAHARIVVHEEGLATFISADNTSICVNTGNVHSPVLKVFELPVQLWIAMLKGCKSEVIQVLVGGDRVCLRNQNMIIVTRVLI